MSFSWHQAIFELMCILLAWVHYLWSIQMMLKAIQYGPYSMRISSQRVDMSRRTQHHTNLTFCEIKMAHAYSGNKKGEPVKRHMPYRCLKTSNHVYNYFIPFGNGVTLAYSIILIIHIHRCSRVNSKIKYKVSDCTLYFELCIEYQRPQNNNSTNLYNDRENLLDFNIVCNFIWFRCKNILSCATNFILKIQSVAVNCSVL